MPRIKSVKSEGSGIQGRGKTRSEDNLHRQIGTARPTGMPPLKFKALVCHHARNPSKGYLAEFNRLRGQNITPKSGPSQLRVLVVDHRVERHRPVGCSA